ncbi:MAG: hypothetical protein CVT88_05090 [Candidatus Altiarchaeales archaeon HGW-Altiarchaeales-1]|nr:MAG: hypothetical protein CVT89_07335 [Candidatus Altiarchaeales archaeon HGW-Altiarchaeales-2]PKP59604.1 MAG: hypothetical protein CVT88_05090 [Candidatus Altiarchaeales archaeon HGW-Altiarchaeales-1]
MKQHEAVIKVMEENGGFSTLKYLNEKVFKVEGIEWRTKTPFASIRRIVQDSRFFFKIKPGLWALKSHENKLPNSILEIIEESKEPEKEQKYTHYYYQGILAEIGTLSNYRVYIPAQDKNRPYLNKQLKDVTTLETLPSFTYDYIIKTIKSIDVIWVNERNFPHALFEVEYSTNFKDSLTRFHEVMDFNTRMCIVSDKKRTSQFYSVLNLSVYKDIKDRIKFYDYEYLENYYSNPFKFKQFMH